MDSVEISETVLEHAKGNPLSLVVLGCALFGRSTEHEWPHVLDELGKESNNSLVRNVLRIGYDALNDDEKKMFLEIARYFIGMDLKAVVRCGNGVLSYYIDHENGRRDYRGSPAVPPKVVLKYVFSTLKLVFGERAGDSGSN